MLSRRECLDLELQMVGTGTTSSESEKEDDEEVVVDRTTPTNSKKLIFVNNLAEWQNVEVSLNGLCYRRLTFYILTRHFWKSFFLAMPNKERVFWHAMAPK